MNYPIKFKIIGAGGHGIKLLGTVIAKIAVSRGQNATLSLDYDSAVRGGNTEADVVISDQKISNPVVEHPDLLIMTSDNHYDATRAKTVWADEGVVKPPKGADVFPFFAVAREKLQSSRVGNMVLLGKILSFLEIEQKDVDFSLFIKKSLELNLKAIEEGYQLN